MYELFPSKTKVSKAKKNYKSMCWQRSKKYWIPILEFEQKARTMETKSQ